VTFQLIYDVAETSTAPFVSLVWGLGPGIAGAIWAAWLRRRGLALHAGVWILFIACALLLGVSFLSRLEQQSIVARTDAKTVEGPVTGHWEKRERRYRQNDYANWEGFFVGGVAFMYVRNVEQNYFHNGGDNTGAIADGVVLRLKYVEEKDGDTVYNHIVRVERAAP
jgi:hypothetical protein